MTSSLLALFLAIEATAAPGRASELADFRRQAEVADHDGDRREADRAADSYLDAAGTTALAAAWSAQGNDRLAAAEKALDDAVAFVVPMAARHENWWLVLRALAWNPRAAEANRAALRRALVEASYGARMLPDDVLRAAAAADPTVAVALAVDQDRSPPVTVAQAQAAGAHGTNWLEGELTRALDAGDREAARRAAEALVARDRLHVEALLALEILQEDPQRLRRANLELPDLVRTWNTDSPRTLIRVHHALAREPGAVRLRLALAWRQLHAHASADARREAMAIVADTAAPPRAREAAGAIAALAALDLGQGASFSEWLQRQPGRPSLFIAGQALAGAGIEKKQPRSVVEARRSFLTRLLTSKPAADPSQVRGPWRWAAIKDDKLDAGVRRHALDLVLADDAALAQAGRTCAPEKLTFDACVVRIETVMELDSASEQGDDEDDDDERVVDVDPAALPKLLGPNLTIPASWLSALRTLPPEKLALLGPWLDGLRKRPVARSRPFALLDIQVRWARKDAAGARRAFDEALPLLPANERVALRLLVEDLDRKLATFERAASAARVPVAVEEVVVGDPATGPEPEWLAQFEPGKDRLATLQRGLAQLGNGYGRKALETLRPLLGALSGPEQGEIAGYVFLAAVAAGDDKLRAQAAAQVTATAPGSAAALRVAAVQAPATADAVGPDAPAARWMRAAPGSDPAARAWLAAATARGGVPVPGARAQDLMARAGRILDSGFARVAALLSAAPRADAGCWKAVVTEAVDRLSACPAAALAAVGKVGFGLEFLANRRVGEARDAAGIVRAATTAAQLAREEPGTRHDQRAWLWYVAGDFARSRASLGVVAAEDHPLAMLLGAKPESSARRRRDLYRQLASQSAGGRSDDEDDGDDDAKDDHARSVLDWSAAARDAGTPHRRAEIWHLACLAITGRESSQGNALTACGTAWRQGRRTPAVATGLAAALFGDIEAARKEGFDAKTFLAEARKALGDRLPGEISAHEGHWLVTLGRLEEAARAFETAWTAGAGEIGEGVSSEELATTPFNPLLARYRASITGSTSRKAFALALVSITAGDIEAAGPYTAQARAFFDPQVDKEDEKGLVLFEDLLTIIAADTKDRALDRPGIVRVARKLFEPGTKEPAADLERDYPRSALVSLLVLEDGNTSDPKPLIGRAKALAARFPRASVVAADCAALLARAGLPRDANAVWSTAKAAHPDDPFLRGAAPGAEPVAAPQPGKTVFASAASWARALSAPVEIPSDAAALQIVNDAEHGISAVLPAAFKKESMGGPGIKLANGDVNLVFMRIPRMTYCDGLACLDQLMPTFELQGFKKQWRRVLTSPVGPGAEGFLTTGGRGLLVASIPAGGDLYFVMAGGALDQMSAQANAIKMAYRSFRPLGLVLPQPVAARLAPYYSAGDARGQLQERLATASPSAIARGCPLRELLDATEALATRRGLLLDAFLTTPWSATRLRLLGCEAGGPPSPALTVAALWDDDRAVRKAGVERAFVDPAGVVTEAKRLMPGDVPIEPAAGSTGPSHNHRWLQLLLALPTKERSELARALLRRDEAHLRAVGLLAPRFSDVDLGRELQRIVRDGSTADVKIALRAFPDQPGQPLRDAVWARFDRAKAPLAAAEKSLLFDLAEYLGHAPAAGDRARLERLLKLVTTGPRDRRPVAVVDRLRVEALLHPPAQARARAELPAGNPIAALDQPLSRLLPGNRWSYFTLPRPELLLSRIGRLGRRLKASSRERQTLSQAIVSRLIGEASSVRADSGGIDLHRPIECAAPEGRFGELICAASLEPDVPAGAAETLRALGVIQMVTGGAVVLPVVLPGLPFILHESIYRRTDSTAAGQRTALVRESAEISFGTPAGPLTWTAGIDLNADGAGDLDDKIVLRSKNRLLFSNSPALARRFLMPTAAGPPAAAAASSSPAPAAAPPSLADDPDFGRASGRFVQGADLTGVVINTDVGETGLRGPVTLELTVTARGMAARVRVPFRQGGTNHGAGALVRALPKSPALLFGAGEVGLADQHASRNVFLPDPVSLPPAEGAGVEPPTWLGAATSALAFGWYPRVGQHFWDSWIGIVTWDEKVAAAWKRRGLPDPIRDGKTAVSGGYRFQLAGQTLLVANDQALLDEAARKQAADPPSAVEEPVSGLFDGGLVASSLEDVAERAPNKDAGATLRSWAALASVVKTATLSSSVDRQRGEVVIESLLAPEMEGTTPTALVDEWVAESRIRNTLMLPRALPLADAGKPIKFVLDVEHDKNFTRAFPTTARQQVERVGQGRWRVSVSPSPKPEQPVRAEALTPGERARWLDASNVSPRIASAAREIIPDKTDPRQAAQLVLDWMKRNMTYELTPRDISDETILERRRGDCSEYSKLAVALLRARGIPARTRSGFLAETSTLVAHAWVEFFDGTGWREIDPTNGTPSVDARHIEASVADVLSLLSLAQIRIASVE